jgi:protein-tyrosine-phosphatase
MSSAKEDLSALLGSEGFVLLRNYARTQWGSNAFNAKVHRAMDQFKTDSAALAQELLRLSAIQKEVNAILSWPGDELRKLEHQEAREAQPVSMVRGGR